MDLKIRKIGNCAGVILPEDLLAHLDAEAGQTVFVTKIPGGIALRKSDAEFAAQMAGAREVMARRGRALGKLAR